MSQKFSEGWTIWYLIKYNKLACQQVKASKMKPVFLLWLCSFGNKLWSFCEASPWVYVKRILNESLPCLAFCKNSVNDVEVNEQATSILEYGITRTTKKMQSQKHLPLISRVMVLSKVARFPSLTWFGVETCCPWTNSHQHIFVSYIICSGKS